MRILLRPATKADVIAFRGKPYRESFKGIVGELDGEIVGIGGVLHTQVLQAFSSMKDEARKHPRDLILAARMFRDVLNSYNSPIFAEASEKEKNSTGYLEYVGFEHYDKRIYRWPINNRT
jgi:hypothetical protein